MPLTPKELSDRAQIERIWREVADNTGRIPKGELALGPNDWKLLEALLNATPEALERAED